MAYFCYPLQKLETDDIIVFKLNPREVNKTKSLFSS